MDKIEVRRMEDDEKLEAQKEEREAESKETSGAKAAKTPEEMTKRELLKKLKETEEESHKNYDLYMRTYAEMENVKKRGIKERKELAKYANESLIKEILPVIDNLDKAISHAQNDENSKALLEGLELMRDNLMKTLEKAGLQEVEAQGKPFDPNVHESVSMQDDDTVDPGHVLVELQKGYLLNGRLLRPSMVVISQRKGKTNQDFT